jgi:hypothetical protein
VSKGSTNLEKVGWKSDMRFGAIQQVNHTVVHPEARCAGFSGGLSVLSILLASNRWNYLSLWNPNLTILLDITQKILPKPEINQFPSI